MNKRPFWVRSATPEGATPLDSGLAARTLMWQYPGCMGALSVFHLTLTEGYSPHDLHVHPFEQMVVVLSGRLDLRSSEGDHPLGPRSAFLVPPDTSHTVQAAGPEPTMFLVCRWTCQPSGASQVPNRLRVFEVDGSDFWNDERHSRRQRLCEEQRLGNGGTLVVDAIRVAPQTEYPLRADDHDVMLVLLRGHIESLGPGFDAPAVVYGPAGMMGRLAPLSPDPIEMLAFEFHPPPATSPASV